MNPVGAVILVVLILVVLFMPRRWAVLGMMAGVLYLTQGQVIQVVGFNLFATRFLEVAGFARVMARREYSFTHLNGIDRALLVVYGYTSVVFLLRSNEGQAYEIAMALDAWLCYFTFRGLVQDSNDLRDFLRDFLVLLAPYVMLVLVESQTRHNLFSFMGGILSESWLREGRVRCQGSFRYASLLGAFGASFFPLYVGMAIVKAERRLALMGVGLCVVIIWASNSGMPMNALAVGLVGWLLWTVRTKMRMVRWGMVGVIVLLALVMKAPVWYLIARAGSVTGGSGWHRSYLIDVAVRHLDKWWFAGMPIRETSDWFPYIISVTGGADLTNQFIAFGIDAGLAAIALLILLLTRAFSSLGKALAAVRSRSIKPSGIEFLLWGLGVMLVVHIVNWLGVTYFDQMYVVWFMQLATLSSLAEKCAEIMPIRMDPT